MIRGMWLSLAVTMYVSANFTYSAPYDNDKISLSFVNMPLAQALTVIAEKGHLNLVVSDAVDGQVTLELNQVDWEQAFYAVLHSKGLNYRIVDNIVYVGLPNEVARSSTLFREVIVFPLQFSSAEQVAVLLKEAFSDKLNPAFSVSIDSYSNSIIVRGNPQQLEQVRFLLSAIDQKKQQVEIEARIVTFYQRDHHSLGINWTSVLTESQTTAEFLLSPAKNLTTTTVGAATQNIGEASMLLKLTRLGSNVLLDLELAALQAESKAKVISSPRLVTVDKTTAIIEQGTEVPYQASTSGGGTSIEFKKAVLSLEVTPYVLGNNTMRLELSVTQDRPGEVVQAGTGQAVAINTQRVTSHVQVNDGETLALGGIYQKTQTDSVYGVPLLADVPLFGHLFRQTRKEWTNSELVIFITTRLIEP